MYALLRSARHGVDVEIYELEDSTAAAILAADAQRGVHVRVLLDKSFVGRYNQPAFTYLKAHGVTVRWAPRGSTSRTRRRSSSTTLWRRS